jgi:hypothetical protein
MKREHVTYYIPILYSLERKTFTSSLVTYLNELPKFEQHVFGYGIDNGHQKDMCLKAIDLLVHNLLTTLNLIISVIWYFFHSCNFF